MFSQQTNLNISTIFLFNLVTTQVLHLWSLLLAHLPAPVWKSQIAVFSMLHLLCGMNYPLMFMNHEPNQIQSLHFHLSRMAVHHLHYEDLHFHYFNILSLIHSFILNLRLGSLAKNLFLHTPFPLPSDGRTLGPFNVFILLNSWICLHSVLD